MEQEELLQGVRALRARRYTPAEIGRALDVSKAEAARLVRVVACEREGGATAPSTSDANGIAVGSQPRCWVSPGWRSGLLIENDHDWPVDTGAPAQASDSGVVCVLVAVAEARDKLSVCGYLVDTWCLGLKNAIGPQRMGRRELEGFKRHFFRLWESEGIPVPLALAQHLVLGAVEYARGLGFKPHQDFLQARRLLGAWDGQCSITFGRDGKPNYMNGPNDDPQRVLATLLRTVGRDGFHYTVSIGDFDEPDGADGGFRYSASLSNVGEPGRGGVARRTQKHEARVAQPHRA